MGTAEGGLEFPEIAYVSCQFTSTLYPNIAVKGKCVLKSIIEC